MKKVDYEFYKELVLQEIPLEPCGKHHKDIAFNTGLRPVFVRDIIRMLRDDGIPICSNPREGYWMARTSTEIQSVINMFESYINSMANTIASLKIARFNKLNEEGDIE